MYRLMVFEASSVEKLVVVVVVLSSNSTIYFLSDDSNTLYFGHLFYRKLHKIYHHKLQSGNLRRII